MYVDTWRNCRSRCACCLVVDCTALDGADVDERCDLLVHIRINIATQSRFNLAASAHLKLAGHSHFKIATRSHHSLATRTWKLGRDGRSAPRTGH